MLCGTPRVRASNRGTIQGSVTDPSGAIVAKAEITVTNLDTAIAHQVPVNSKGYYVAPNLQPGRYQVTAASPSFSTEVVVASP